MSSVTVAFFFSQKEMNAENVLIVWDCPHDSLIFSGKPLLKIGYVLKMMESLKITCSLINLSLENEVLS